MVFSAKILFFTLLFPLRTRYSKRRLGFVRNATVHFRRLRHVLFVTRCCDAIVTVVNIGVIIVWNRKKERKKKNNPSANIQIIIRYYEIMFDMQARAHVRKPASRPIVHCYCAGRLNKHLLFF